MPSLQKPITSALLGDHTPSKSPFVTTRLRQNQNPSLPHLVTTRYGQNHTPSQKILSLPNFITNEPHNHHKLSLSNPVTTKTPQKRSTSLSHVIIIGQCAFSRRICIPIPFFIFSYRATSSSSIRKHFPPLLIFPTSSVVLLENKRAVGFHDQMVHTKKPAYHLPKLYLPRYDGASWILYTPKWIIHNRIESINSQTGHHLCKNCTKSIYLSYWKGCPCKLLYIKTACAVSCLLYFYYLFNPLIFT